MITDHAAVSIDVTQGPVAAANDDVCIVIDAVTYDFTSETERLFMGVTRLCLHPRGTRHKTAFVQRIDFAKHCS